MKYVIKEVSGDASYMYETDNKPALGYTGKLSEATQYATIQDAIRAIVHHVWERPNGSFQDFTIVGVREIPQPRYEEVEL